MKVAVLMPAFGEGSAVADVLATLRGAAHERPELGGIMVYLVDDGGGEKIELRNLPSSAPEFDVVLARHPINLGQGAALETARLLALGAADHSVFVTMDSDGQHRTEDLPELVAAVERGADAVFGNRFAAQESNVPFGRSLVLFGARVFEWALTGLWLSDAHNGYRAFSRRAITAIRIRQNRMAHATEIRQQVSRRRREWQIAEVPVTIRYSRETLAKGQSSLGAISILRDLAYRFLFGPE